MSDVPEYQFDFIAPASASGLAGCRDAMEGSVLYEKLPDRLRFAADLALDELATNTIKYGGCGDAAFEISMRYGARGLHIEYKDRGTPFDPWKQEAEIEASLDSTDDPEIGGRGLIMMKELSASRAYERRDGTNVVTLSVLESAESEA